MYIDVYVLISVCLSVSSVLLVSSLLFSSPLSLAPRSFLPSFLLLLLALLSLACLIDLLLASSILRFLLSSPRHTSLERQRGEISIRRESTPGD